MAAYPDAKDRPSDSPHHRHSLCSHRCSPGHWKQQGPLSFTLARLYSCLTGLTASFVPQGYRNHYQLYRLRSAKRGVKPASCGGEPCHRATLQLPSPFIRGRRPVLATTICIHLRAGQLFIASVYRPVRHPFQYSLLRIAIL